MRALEGIPLCFFDGIHILVPEREAAAIEGLRTRFDAVIGYGFGQEWRFATEARAAGVSERLVDLGNAVWDVTGRFIADMVQAALASPDVTFARWSALYRATMDHLDACPLSGHQALQRQARPQKSR